MTFLTLTLLSLGVFRLWRILSTDTVLDRPRDWLLGTQNLAGGVTHYKRKRLADFLGCAWCFGFWLSLGAFAAWHWWSAEDTALIATPLAISAVVGLVTAHLD